MDVQIALIFVHLQLPTNTIIFEVLPYDIIPLLPQPNHIFEESMSESDQGLNMFADFMVSLLETRIEKPMLADDFSVWLAGCSWSWKVIDPIAQFGVIF